MPIWLISIIGIGIVGAVSTWAWGPADGFGDDPGADAWAQIVQMSHEEGRAVGMDGDQARCVSEVVQRHISCDGQLDGSCVGAVRAFAAGCYEGAGLRSTLCVADETGSKARPDLCRTHAASDAQRCRQLLASVESYCGPAGSEAGSEVAAVAADRAPRAEQASGPSPGKQP